MEVVACRTKKINTVFIVAMSIHVPRHLYQMDFSSLLDTSLYEDAMKKLRKDST